MGYWWLLLPGAGLILLWLLLRPANIAPPLTVQATGTMPSIQTPADVAAAGLVNYGPGSVVSLHP